MGAERYFFSAGLIGYAYAEQQYPGLPESSYRIFQPANDLLFNRSLYSDPQSHYDLTSWMPQVNLADCHKAEAKPQRKQKHLP